MTSPHSGAFGDWLVFNDWLAALAGIGLAISFYILYVQKARKKPVCLIGKSCDIVVGSSYAKTFGLENSLLGIFYYGAILAFASGLPVPYPLALGLSLIAALFSVYLTYLQFFVIKGLCDWCMVVNITNAVIFAILLSNP